MTSRFFDKFARADGAIGSNYTVACGGVLISDQSVIPINADEIVSGVSPLFPSGVTSWKTQVLFTNEAMDGPNYVVRGTWAHDGESASEIDPSTVDTPSSFSGSFSYAAIQALDTQRQIFSGVAGFSSSEFRVGTSGSAARVPGAMVTGSFYETLGCTRSSAAC